MHHKVCLKFLRIKQTHSTVLQQRLNMPSSLCNVYIMGSPRLQKMSQGPRSGQWQVDQCVIAMGAINVLIIFAEMFKNDSDDYSCLNQYGYEYFLPFSQLSGGQEASFRGFTGRYTRKINISFESVLTMQSFLVKIQQERA